MKTIKLNVGEIVSARMILNEVKGGIIDIQKAFKVLEKIEMSEDESKKVGLKLAGSTMQWKDEKYTKQVELSDEQAGLLIAQIKGKKDFSTLGGKYVISLAEKIDPEMFIEEKK